MNQDIDLNITQMVVTSLYYRADNDLFLLQVILTCSMAYIVGLAVLCSMSAAIHIHQNRCLRERTPSTCTTLHPSRFHAANLQCMFTRPHPQECTPKPGGISENASRRLKLRSRVSSNQTSACVTIDSYPVCTKLVGLEERNIVFSVDNKSFENNDHNQTRLELLEFSLDTHTRERMEGLLKWFKTSVLSKNKSQNICTKGCERKITSDAVSLGFSPLNGVVTSRAVPGYFYSPRLVVS